MGFPRAPVLIIVPCTPSGTGSLVGKHREERKTPYCRLPLSAGEAAETNGAAPGLPAHTHKPAGGIATVAGL